MAGSGIRDNRPARGTVASFLKEKIRLDSELSFVSAYFTIYAYYYSVKCAWDTINGPFYSEGAVQRLCSTRLRRLAGGSVVGEVVFDPAEGEKGSRGRPGDRGDCFRIRHCFQLKKLYVSITTVACR